MLLAVILGTRPEIIKNAPVIEAARRLGLEVLVIHSGQHYDHAMDGRFFEELGLAPPDVQLKAGGLPYAEQVGYLTRELGPVLSEHRPTAVLVQGDTVTVMCGALAAAKLGIPVIHHEAGLRSRDYRMPEEYHRIITDHTAELLCAPTADAHLNLMAEGVPALKTLMTGNTIVDAVRRFAGLAQEKSDILTRLGLTSRKYFLPTLHRAENVDDSERFKLAMEALSRVLKENPDRPIVFPVHPRVERRRQEFGAEWPKGLVTIPPTGYLDMLRLMQDADLVLTDSGGLQEEASILGTPCVTIRDSTERPETVAAGVNVIAGLEPDKVVAAVRAMRGRRFEVLDLYGDGRAAERIVDEIIKRCS